MNRHPPESGEGGFTLMEVLVAMSLLALGPIFGIWHMFRIRSLPTATKMAGGRK